MKQFWLALVAMLLAMPVLAHETRPAYLDMRARALSDSQDRPTPPPYVYDVIWNRPVTEGLAAAALLPLRLEFPSNCKQQGESQLAHRPGLLRETFVLYCATPLRGQVIGIKGLEQSITDALVHLTTIGAEQQQLRLTPSAPSQRLRGGGVAYGAYLGLGITHLLGGADHILFVLGLWLLVRGWWRLVGVITAFTLAHSATLALVVLGALRLPITAVEIAIALSVLYVVLEASRPQAERDMIADRYPMLVAFGFGLLHGGGFASVLSDIGLPEQARLWSLLLFNIGLEIGQLLLIAIFVALGYVGPRLRLPIWLRQYWRDVVLVPMGGLASYWLIARMLAIFGI